MPLFRNRTRQQPHPAPVIDRPRMEPMHMRAAFPVGSLREAPTTRRELAPQPVPQSAYDTIGKRAPEIIRPVTSLAMAEWRGVAAWPYTANRPMTALRVPIAPHQAMNPFAERVNVDMAPQSSLGAQTSIKAVPWITPTLGRLGILS